MDPGSTRSFTFIGPPTSMIRTDATWSKSMRQNSFPSFSTTAILEEEGIRAKNRKTQRAKIRAGAIIQISFFRNTLCSILMRQRLSNLNTVCPSCYYTLSPLWLLQLPVRRLVCPCNSWICENALTSFLKGVIVSKRLTTIAGVAQLVERLICNQQVVGSRPIASSSFNLKGALLFQQGSYYGGVPERSNGADCKSVALRLRWSESILLHHER